MITMIYDHNDWWSWWPMIMMIAIILSVRNHEWRRRILDYSCSVHDDHDDWWSSWLMIMIFSGYFLSVRKCFTLGRPSEYLKKYSKCETYGLFMISWSVHDEVISQVHICLESKKHSQSNFTSRPSIHTSETITNHKTNTMISQVHSC